MVSHMALNKIKERRRANNWRKMMSSIMFSMGTKGKREIKHGKVAWSLC